VLHAGGEGVACSNHDGAREGAPLLLRHAWLSRARSPSKVAELDKSAISKESTMRDAAQRSCSQLEE